MVFWCLDGMAARSEGLVELVMFDGSMYVNIIISNLGRKPSSM